MVIGNSSQPRAKVSSGRSGRGGRLRGGSGSKGQSSRSSNLRKYERKRSAEDLLVERSQKGSNSVARKESNHNKGSKKETSCLKTLQRQFLCFAPEVSFELDQEASNACKLLGCTFLTYLLLPFYNRACF